VVIKQKATKKIGRVEVVTPRILNP
jgi:hypothetical protein